MSYYLAHLDRHKNAEWRESSPTRQLHLSDSARLRMGKTAVKYFMYIYGILTSEFDTKNEWQQAKFPNSRRQMLRAWHQHQAAMAAEMQAENVLEEDVIPAPVEEADEIPAVAAEMVEAAENPLPMLEGAERKEPAETAKEAVIPEMAELQAREEGEISNDSVLDLLDLEDISSDDDPTSASSTRLMRRTRTLSSSSSP